MLRELFIHPEVFFQALLATPLEKVKVAILGQTYLGQVKLGVWFSVPDSINSAVLAKTFKKNCQMIS